MMNDAVFFASFLKFICKSAQNAVTRYFYPLNLAWDFIHQLLQNKRNSRTSEKLESWTKIAKRHKDNLSLMTRYLSANYARYHHTSLMPEDVMRLEDAANNLIKSLDGIESSVIRVGSLLVVKITKNGKTTLRIVGISPALSQWLADDPNLWFQPEKILSFLETEESNSTELQFSIRRESTGT